MTALREFRKFITVNTSASQLLYVTFPNKLFFQFRGVQLHRPITMLKDHFLSAVCDCFWARSRSILKATISFVVSVCPSLLIEQLGSHQRDFHEILHLKIFRKFFLNKVKIHQDLIRIKDTLHADLYTVTIISRSILLRMGNVSDKICIDNQNTRFLFRNLFPKIVPRVR